MPVRVALISAPASWSGVEVHTTALASQLSAQGHEVVILEIGRQLYSQNCLPESVSLHHIDFDQVDSRAESIKSIGFLRWCGIFRKIDVDIAIIAKGTFDFGSLAMEAAARVCCGKLCVIEHLHAPFGPRPKARFLTGGRPQLGLWWYGAKLKGYLRSIFPNVVFCVSEAIARTSQEDFAYPRSKLSVKYAGVEMDRFRPDPKARSDSRIEWQIPETAFVFGSVGRLSAMKNHVLLIRAFSRVTEAHPDADLRLVIVGEGPKREALESEIRSRGLSTQVHLAGFCARIEKPLAGFDAFCLSSIREAFGIALVEGLATGIPAIATAVGGVPEILNDSRMGWLVSEGDEFAMADAMMSIIHLTPESREEMGAFARKSVSEWFDAAQCWSIWVESICTIASGKKVVN